MGKLLDIVTPLHQMTKRNYLSRMNDDKVHCMLKAKEYEYDYWDGDRRYGYGGYQYIPGRWKPVAQTLIKQYKLTNDSKILDVGCGKAFLLYEMKLLLPKITIVGIDISQHALNEARIEIQDDLMLHRAQDQYPWDANSFDLVISLGCLHNLKIFDLQKALMEIERVGINKYVMLESYRNEQELFNLQCWALTCEAFYNKEEWQWLYKHFNYTGDYEFIYF